MHKQAVQTTHVLYCPCSLTIFNKLIYSDVKSLLVSNIWHFLKTRSHQQKKKPSAEVRASHSLCLCRIEDVRIASKDGPVFHCTAQECELQPNVESSGCSLAGVILALH